MKKTKLLVALSVTLGLALSLIPTSKTSALSGWSYVRSDAYSHYACKTYIANSAYGPLYKVNTVSFGFDQGPRDIGVYAKISRSGRLVNQTTNLSRYYGMIGTTSYASAYYNDKLWIQGSYYGPAPNNGTVYVKYLTNCR